MGQAFDSAQSAPGRPGYHLSMISFEDCIGLCGLTEAEIAAIAEHEHVPEIAAAILGQYLLHHQHGPERIRQMLVDDIRVAICAGNVRHAAELTSALRHLIATHPEASLAATAVCPDKACGAERQQ
jgi:hypothetical protein